MKNLIKENKKVYDNLYQYEHDGWEDHDKRYNFYWLFKIEKYTHKSLDGSSVLDVGCGTGDMVKYLPEDIKYLGIDIYRPGLNTARKKYPDYKFLYKNITSNFKNHQLFGFVFCSGALSLNLSSIDEDNYEFLEKAVISMWNLCKYGTAFNILTDEKHKKNDTYLFHYNMDKVKEILKKITKSTKKIRSKYTPLDGNNDQHTIYLIK